MGQESSFFQPKDDLDAIIAQMQEEDSGRQQAPHEAPPKETAYTERVESSSDTEQHSAVYISKELTVPDSISIGNGVGRLSVRVRPLFPSHRMHADAAPNELGRFDNSYFVDELNRIRYEKLDTRWKSHVQLQTFWGMHMQSDERSNNWLHQWNARLERPPIKQQPKDPSQKTTSLLSKKLNSLINAKKPSKHKHHKWLSHTSATSFGVRYDFACAHKATKCFDPHSLHDELNKKSSTTHDSSSPLHHHLERDEYDLIHFDLQRLATTHCETVLISMQCPFVDKELRETLDEGTGVITKRMPSVQKFSVQLLVGAEETSLDVEGNPHGAPSPGTELCRYSIHVNCYSSKPCLLGMLYRKHQSTTWHFRATNSFKTQMPKLLNVSILEASDLFSFEDKGGLSDPYVTIDTLAEKTKRTDVVKRTLNPTWNASFPYLIQQNLKGSDASIRLELFNSGANEHESAADEEACSMGVVRVSLAEVFSATNSQFSMQSERPRLLCKKWYPLDTSQVSDAIKNEQKNRNKRPKIFAEFRLEW